MQPLPHLLCLPPISLACASWQVINSPTEEDDLLISASGDIYTYSTAYDDDYSDGELAEVFDVNYSFDYDDAGW